MFKKNCFFISRIVLVLCAISFTGLAAAFTPPTLPVHVGKFSADGLPNNCLTTFYGYNANFQSCDLTAYTTEEKFLFGSDSTTVTTAMGGCLSADASLLDILDAVTDAENENTYNPCKSRFIRFIKSASVTA